MKVHGDELLKLDHGPFWHHCSEAFTISFLDCKGGANVLDRGSGDLNDEDLNIIDLLSRYQHISVLPPFHRWVMVRFTLVFMHDSFGNGIKHTFTTLSRPQVNSRLSTLHNFVKDATTLRSQGHQRARLSVLKRYYMSIMQYPDSDPPPLNF